MNLKYILSLSLLLVFSACTKDFEEINTNPNVPEVVNPQFLLTNIIWNAANNNAVDAWNAGNFIAQLTARKDFNEIDRWDLRSNQELWDKSYLLLRDINTLIELGENGNEAYKGIALVMRAFLASTLTDLWGDVPYSDALKGASEGNFTPIYDTQETIYTGPEGVLNTLEQAITILDANQNGLAVLGDVLYDGDLNQWVKFANSLRVRYLIRISKRVDVSTDLQSIVSEGRLFESNEDNALVPYLASAPNQWFVHNIRVGDFGDVRMSTTIQGVLEDLNDPRMNVWFRPTEASANGDAIFTGIPNGIGPATRGDYDFSEISLPGPIFREMPDGVDAVFMLYSELQFALAEAAQNGWISGDASAYYEAGITASFDYFKTALPTDYLSQENVQLEESRAVEQIITQKWLASMLVGYEGWFNFRRTGFPSMQVAVENLNNDQYPLRYIYPTTEQALNLNNYNEAVSRVGGDNYNVKGWWEK